ncbi:MAG: hypothetical protein P4L56_03355 [Candidatus Sulfopaludibacter sp.]|nr:hypothetical protein [Candidatus Sulfopaludibacter sp.]
MHANPDGLIDRITGGAEGESEQLAAFLRALEEAIPVPCDALMSSEPVSVVKFDFDGNARRGLTAKCRRTDGREYVVAAADIEFPRRTEAARYVAAYRQWMGLKPLPPESVTPDRRGARRRTAGAVAGENPVSLVEVLSGFKYDHPDHDSIGISNDLTEPGDVAGAYEILNDLCEADLRCLYALRTSATWPSVAVPMCRQSL